MRGDRILRILRPSLALAALAALVVLLGLALAGPAHAATKSPKPAATPSGAIVLQQGSEVQFGNDVVVPEGTTMPSVVVFGGDITRRRHGHGRSGRLRRRRRHQRHRGHDDRGLRRRRHSRSRRRSGEQSLADRLVPRPVRRRADAGARRRGRRPDPEHRRDRLERGGRLARAELLRQSAVGTQLLGLGRADRVLPGARARGRGADAGSAARGCSGTSVARRGRRSGGARCVFFIVAPGDPGRARDQRHRACCWSCPTGCSCCLPTSSRRRAWRRSSPRRSSPGSAAGRTSCSP